MSQNTSQRSATPTTSQTTTQSLDSVTNTEQAPRVLRLRGIHANSSRSVQWAEDVVDNEGMGKKSSKVCCIYHRPKAVDESSDESSSSSDSDSDSDFDADRRGKRSNHNKDGHSCDHSHDGNSRKKRREGKEDRAPSPNAYERVPKPKPKPSPADEPQKPAKA